MVDPIIKLKKYGLEVEILNKQPLSLGGGESSTKGFIKAYRYAYTLKEIEAGWEVTLPYSQVRKTFILETAMEAVSHILKYYESLER